MRTKLLFKQIGKGKSKLASREFLCFNWKLNYLGSEFWRNNVARNFERVSISNTLSLSLTLHNSLVSFYHFPFSQRALCDWKFLAVAPVTKWLFLWSLNLRWRRRHFEIFPAETWEVLCAPITFLHKFYAGNRITGYIKTSSNAD